MPRKSRVCRLAYAALMSAAVAVASEPLPRQARAALDKATGFMRSIATEGGYLWRYSPDLQTRAGERPATATQIWVQPPGTPAMGMAFLRAYEATGDARQLEAARAAAIALVVGQLESGGWDYVIELDPKLSRAWYRRADIGRVAPADAAKRKNISTYDDDATQSALRFLLAITEVTKNSPDPRDGQIREARDYGLAKLLEAQRPSGGWPQRWNGTPVDPRDYPVRAARFPADYPREYPKLNYMSHYTLNDNTHRDCVVTLLEAAEQLGNPEYRTAALRGGDFLLLAQLPEPQPIWAQQYNPQLEPAWARAFEPPAVCTSESVGVMRLLIDLYLDTGDDKYLEPLPRAIAWFKRSEISPGRWARIYELRTNRPIYGDRDGEIHYDLEDLSPERQSGYSWQGAYGVAEVIAYYEKVKAAGTDARRQARKAGEFSSRRDRRGRARDLEQRVREVIAALDGEGRWLTDAGGTNVIRTDTFITNVRLLSEYLEAVR